MRRVFSGFLALVVGVLAVAVLVSAPAQAAPAKQTIAFNPPASLTLPQSPYRLAAAASSGLAVSFTASTKAVCTVSGSLLTLRTTGTCTIAATQSGGSGYGAAPAVKKSITVTKAAQTIDLKAPTSLTLLQSPTALVASATSGLPVLLTTSTSQVCTISGNMLTSKITGTCIVTATQPGDPSYTAAPAVTKSILVTKAPQTIDFTPPTSLSLPQSPYPLAASATSGLPVSFNSATPSVCTISGSSLILVSGGTCTVTAHQPGNETYDATLVERSIGLAKATQQLAFAQPEPDSRVATDPPFELVASASSGLPVTFTSTMPTVCTVSGSTVTLVAAGTCTITAEQAGDDLYAAADPVSRSVNVSKATQTVTFDPAPPTTGTVGDEPIALHAVASSGLPVSFSAGLGCEVSGNILRFVQGGGSCIVYAYNLGNDVYDLGVTWAWIAVAKGSQSISFTAPTSKGVGDHFTLDASASSGLPVSYRSQTYTCSVVGNTVTVLYLGTCTITAYQWGDAGWDPAPPVTVEFPVGIGAAVQISAGLRHTCAITTGGEIGCWGDNAYGQLGDGTTVNSTTPVRVFLPAPAVNVSAGGLHTCASDVMGNIYCWGDNTYGQLGTGNTANSPIPLQVFNLHGTADTVSVSAGSTHTCAVVSGTGFCWGDNSTHQLGAVSGAYSPVPRPVKGNGALSGISAGGLSSCLATSTAFYCWGGTYFNPATPITGIGAGGGNSVSVGGNHACAVTEGRLYCWGDNTSGQLGTGGPSSGNMPQLVSLPTASSVSAGGRHTCAVTDVLLYCWGDNTSGQLGSGAMGISTGIPEQVSLPTVTGVSAGGSHTCVTTANGAFCWGDNTYGQLGDGTKTSSLSPRSAGTATST